jgi:hypothetical protein
MLILINLGKQNSLWSFLLFKALTGVAQKWPTTSFDCQLQTIRAIVKNSRTLCKHVRASLSRKDE